MEIYLLQLTPPKQCCLGITSYLNCANSTNPRKTSEACKTNFHFLDFQFAFPLKTFSVHTLCKCKYSNCVELENIGELDSEICWVGVGGKI